MKGINDSLNKPFQMVKATFGNYAGFCLRFWISCYQQSGPSIKATQIYCGSYALSNCVFGTYGLDSNNRKYLA